MWANMERPDLLSRPCQAFLSDTDTMLMGCGPCRHGPIYRTIMNMTSNTSTLIHGDRRFDHNMTTNSSALAHGDNMTSNTAALVHGDRRIEMNMASPHLMQRERRVDMNMASPHLIQGGRRVDMNLASPTLCIVTEELI
jgi:hypothetical protein